MNNEMKNFSELEKAILKTLAFFDIFDYPLTLVEIYKWLYQPGSNYQIFDISQILDLRNLISKISTKNGFYFLRGRDIIIQTRLERYQIAEKKFKIALRSVWFLRSIAFIEMIAVCNNVGYNNGTKESDIDFFIVVKKGRLWLSRLMITLVATLLRVRRHDKKTVDRVCLSFYISDDHLDLSDIALKPTDPYLAYWFATLAPIYNEGVYSKFIKANDWLKNYLPNFYFPVLNNRRVIKDSSFVKFLKNFDELVWGTAAGDWLEKFAKLIELKKINKYLGSSINEPNTNVIISESMLKFHKIDRREAYKDLWQKKLNSLEIL